MNALEVLHNRVSIASLEAPAPSGEVLANIQQAALRAADHRLLRPWRYLVIEGEGLSKLGALLAESKEADEGPLSAEDREKWVSKPHRAPMVIVAIATIEDNPKVPEVEQLLSAGAGVQNMLNAAYAQGVGAIWRTGGFAYHPVVKAGLGLVENEQIIGFLYLGTPKGKLREAPVVDSAHYFTSWGR